MSESGLQPEQVRLCRSGMRLSQPKFGERIGVGRISVYQYEHGRRHDTQQSVAVSQTINMACGAAWLGISGHTEVLEMATRAELLPGNDVPRIPSGTIEAWHEEAAKQELQRRGFAEKAEDLIVLPLIPVLAAWSRIVSLIEQRDGEIPKLHPLFSSTVPAVAILEFKTPAGGTMFKVTFLGWGGQP